MKKSIRKQFSTVFILAGIIFLISGSLLVWKIYTVQKKHAVEMQTEVGTWATNEFIMRTHELEDSFSVLSMLYTNLLGLPFEEQVNILSKVRAHKDQRYHDIIDELVLLNIQGNIVSFASRTSLRPQSTLYTWVSMQSRFRSSKNKEPFCSQVSIDENGEPYIVFAFPLINFQTGELTGALASRIRINLIWEEIVRKRVGTNGNIYITDSNGLIVAHSNPSIVFKGIVVETSSQDYFQHGLDGEMKIRVVERADLGNQIFKIFVERPVSEALAVAIQALVVFAGLLLLFVATGIASGVFFTKIFIEPIESLANTAEGIMSGDFSSKSAIVTDNEIGLLAQSFNAMTSQLTSDITELRKIEEDLKQHQAGLELRVAGRTSDLRNLLEFSRILSSTTNLKSLYLKCVELSKTLLKFDFSSLMLLTDDKSSLVIHGTIGFPESSVGTFSLVKGQGLSTYVVQEKRPAVVKNFNSETRFEVPPIVFSKKITSALCVPMMIGEEVIGIFIGHTYNERHFEDEEIALYQSFANQAAIAIDNAIHLKNLQVSELKFKALFDNANDAILVYDLNGTLLEVNQIACERLGYTRAELLHLSPDKFISPQFAVTLHDRIKRVSDRKKDIFESVHMNRSGKEIPIELSCTLIEYNDQPAILGIARDIGERKKMEEELHKNRKLESVGVLAGGIAHDFNNILTAIIGNLNLATLQIDHKNMVHGLLLSAEKAALRARDLTQQLLTFAKGGGACEGGFFYC